MINKNLFEIINDKNLIKIFDIIEGIGGEVKLVGGVVREIFKHNKLKIFPDIDIVTNLIPDQVLKILKKNNIKAQLLNENYGTLRINCFNASYEISTLRSDIKSYGRQSKIRHHLDWYLDAKRRDFTINSIYIDKNSKVFDPLGGLEDLKKGIVKFIGDPNTRIHEDNLRIFRYVRFFSIYSLRNPEKSALDAIKKNVLKINNISIERISNEIKLIFSLPNEQFFKALGLMYQTDLDRVYFGNKISYVKILNYHKIISKINYQFKSNWITRIAILTNEKFLVNRKLKLTKNELNFWNEIKNPINQEQFSRLNNNNWQCEAYKIKNLVLLKYILSLLEKNEFNYKRIKQIKDFKRPIFPIKGKDLIDIGLTSGIEIGKNLLILENEWVRKLFIPNKIKLLEKVKLK